MEIKKSITIKCFAEKVAKTITQYLEKGLTLSDVHISDITYENDIKKYIYSVEFHKKEEVFEDEQN